MICGVGTDIVDVTRFARWTDYPETQLQKTFTQQELIDCTINGILNPEKMATRFAAKEAFYKALSATLVNLKLNKQTFSFIATCPHVAVAIGPWGVPTLQVDWQELQKYAAVSFPALSCYLSLSHEKTMAIAFVIIERAF